MQDNLQDSMIPLAVLRDNQIMPESTGEVLDKELLVGKLILASNIITIVLTFLPVALDFPSIYRNEWFGIADIIRLAEPLIILAINLALFLQGITEPVIMERKSQSRTILLIIWFGFSAALYQQGAGYHSASAIFKAVIRDIRDEAALKAIDPGVNLLILDAYNYARDTWEHTISHYMVKCCNKVRDWWALIVIPICIHV